MSQQHLKNLNILKQHVYAVIPQKLAEKIQDFSIKFFVTNRCLGRSPKMWSAMSCCKKQNFNAEIENR
jgi:hypothetical protein